MSYKYDPYIMVYPSGIDFHFMDPPPDEIKIEDIAHAAGMICRFGGHVKRRSSVAEHQIRTAWWIEANGGTRLEAFCGLMHDAPESYLQDIPSPIKERLGVPLVALKVLGGWKDAMGLYAPDICAAYEEVKASGYFEMEKRIWIAIASKFNLPEELPPIVKQADGVMLVTEARDLCHPRAMETWIRHMPWQPDPTIDYSWPMPDQQATTLFLAEFRRLSQGIV